MIKLRDYQEQALEAIEKALARGVKKQVLNLATGLGKTIVFAELLRRRGKTALVLAHRDELIQQAEDKIRFVYPEAEIGVVKAERNEKDADIVVASIQSLHEKRLKQWEPDRFHTVVIDEAHHAIAPSYKRVIDHFNPELLLGVTATPFRGDRVTLAKVFDEVVYSYGILEGIRNQYLVDIEAYRVQTNVDLDSVKTNAGDFNLGELSERVNVADRNEAIVQAYVRYAGGKKAIVFAVDIEHAMSLTETFRRAGINAAFVHGGTPKEERRSVLEGLKTGEIPVVVNVSVLTEGFDEPSVEAVILARPTKSLALFTQMVGRGTRLHPGKERLILLDIADNTKRHRVVSVKEMVGLKNPVKQGQRLTVAVLEEEKRIPEIRKFISEVFPTIEVEKVPDLLVEFSDTSVLPDYDWRDVLGELEELREDEEMYAEERKKFKEKWSSKNYDTSTLRVTEWQKKALEGFGWPIEEIVNLARFEASFCIDRHMEAMRDWSERKAKLWGVILGISPDEAKRHFNAPWQLKPMTKDQFKVLKHEKISLPPGDLLAGEAAIILDKIFSNKKNGDGSLAGVR